MAFVDIKCLESLLIEGEELSIANEGLGSAITKFGNIISMMIRRIITFIEKLINSIKNKVTHNLDSNNKPNLERGKKVYSAWEDFDMDCMPFLDLLNSATFTINAPSEHESRFERQQKMYDNLEDSYNKLKNIIGSDKIAMNDDIKKEFIDSLNASKNRLKYFEDRTRRLIDEEFNRYQNDPDNKTEGIEKRMNDYNKMFTNYLSMYNNACQLIISHL